MAGIVRRVIQTSNAPAAIGAYSQAVLVDKTLYVSGQIGLDPKTGVLVPGGVAAESEQVMKNMNSILQAAGTTFNNVIKATVLLADINDFGTVNTEYSKHFSGHFPARALFQVAALPKGARVEIEAVAIVDNYIQKHDLTPTLVNEIYSRIKCAQETKAEKRT